MKKRKYKLNLNKIKRNILIIILTILSILYIKYINTYTNKNIKSCQAFSEYAKNNGIALTQNNYNTYLSFIDK